MNELFIFKLFSIFGAGFLTSVSPCVYPTLPLTIGFLTFQSKPTSSRMPTILFFIGQTVAYVFLGFLAVKLTEVFGFSSQSFALNLTLAILLLVLSGFSIFGFMPSGFTAVLKRLQSKIENLSSLFWFAPFLIGAASALVASPCTSPVLGSVLVSVASDPWSAKTLAEMFAYAVGASLLVLILGLGLLKAKSLPRSGKWLNSIHRITSVLIVLGAFYYGYRAYGLY